MVTLREARIQKLLSIAALAERAGVAIATVHLAEQGRRAPQFATMRKIAEALELDPREIAEFRAALDAALEGKEAA